MSSAKNSINDGHEMSEASVPMMEEGSAQKEKGEAKGGRDKCACCPCSRAVVWTVVGVMAVVYLLALGLGLGLGLDSQDDSQGTRKAIGAVAADHSVCSQVGRDMLARGGSAVDAIIASLLCCGVRQPHSMGIGGGLFLVAYSKKTRTVDTYDGREVAPLAATYDTYFNKSFVRGKLAIGVPGEVMAYWEAHQKHGRLPWRDLFAPTIKMVSDGHPLSKSAARALRRLRDGRKVNISRDFPGLCEAFCRADGAIKEAGDEVKMPALAATLRGLAEQGPDYLYSSQAHGAQALIRDIRNMGGLITMEDLENYKVIKKPPVSVALRGDVTLHTLTAPSGGPVLALIARILSGLNLKPADLHNVTTEGAMWHKIVETFKFAYADRFQIADPDFVDISGLLEKMASPEYVQRILQSIDPERTYDTDHYTDITVNPRPESGTTHISVIGPDGDAASATSTINYYFGSSMVSPSTGIILNNEMADFAEPDGPVLDRANPSTPNYIYPGKRPLSSMAPIILVDKAGNPRLVLGSSGGTRITNVNAQVMARVLWLHQSLKQAVEAKRLHHQLFPNVLKWEVGYKQEILDELAKYGHVLEERNTYMAVVQAVSRDPITGQVNAFSDPRKHGLASVLYDTDMKR